MGKMDPDQREMSMEDWWVPNAVQCSKWIVDVGKDADPFLYQSRLQGWEKKSFFFCRRKAQRVPCFASAPEKYFFLPFTGQPLRRRRMRGPQAHSRHGNLAVPGLQECLSPRRELLGAQRSATQKTGARLATLGGLPFFFSV